MLHSAAARPTDCVHLCVSHRIPGPERHPVMLVHE